MLDERKKAFDNISRIFAITRFDIEHHQSINDLSLNIHAENFLRDIFNFLYNANFVNGNYCEQNLASLDLIDIKMKKAYQITTTREKAKIEDTFKVLMKPKYKGYSILIYYLLEKSHPNKKTVAEFKQKFKINIRECIKDYTDIIKDIVNLKTDKIIEFNNRFCKGQDDKYTDKKAFDLVVRHLILQKKKIRKDYDDDFGTIETDKKLSLNEINARITAKINNGLDYRFLVEDLGEDDSTLSELREIVVNGYYKNILIEVLASKVSISIHKKYEVIELHSLAKDNKLNFNKILEKLHQAIEASLEIQDFNSMDIGWIIIAFFFELCDVGYS